MEKVRLRTISTNPPAKLIHNALKPFRENFRGGLFFQYLQRHFNAQARLFKKFSVEYILTDPELWEIDESDPGCESDKKMLLDPPPMDINKKRHASRILSLSADAKIDMSSLSIHICVKYSC